MKRKNVDIQLFSNFTLITKVGAKNIFRSFKCFANRTKNCTGSINIRGWYTIKINLLKK